MKVLNVNCILDPVLGGGTAERTFQLSRHLVKAGQRCALVTTDTGLTPERMAALQGVDVTVIPLVNRRFFLPGPGILRLLRAVRDCDIVHLMSHWNLLNVVVYLVARVYRKPYVVCPAGALVVFGRSKLLKKAFNLLIGRRIIRKASGCIAIAPSELAVFRRYGIGSERVPLIPNGVNPADFTDSDDDGFRRKFGLDGRPIILFVGRLHAIKGPDLLLSAFIRAGEKLWDHQLVFVGPDDGMKAMLVAEVEKHGMSGRVRFVDYLGGADRSNAYHAARLLVIPSRSEAMSIVVLEAGISGTPVLLTDTCGFNDLEKTGAGRVVPADTEAITTSMMEMLGDASALEGQARRMKEFVMERYLWDRIAKKHIELFQGILGEQRVRRAV